MRNAILTLLLFGLLAAYANPAAFYGGLTLARLRGNAVVSDPWTPADLTGLALWLDASDSSTLWADTNATTQATNNGPVARWDDKSGNGYNAWQNTGFATFSPTLTTNVFAKGLSFATTNELSLPSIPQAADTDVIAVVDTTNVGTGLRMFLNRRYGDAGDRGWAAYLGSSSAGLENNPIVFWTAREAQWGSAVKRKAIINWRGYSTQTTSVNVDAGTPVVDTSSTEQNRTEWITIGNRSVQQSEMVVPEIVVANSVSTTDRQKLEGYLAHKWGLAGNLPADHPYKSAAPTK